MIPYKTGYDMMVGVLIEEGVDAATAATIATANVAAFKTEAQSQATAVQDIHGTARFKAVYDGLDTWCRALAP
jgi:hypothetical protein